MKTVQKIWLSILISVFASLGLYAAGQQITSLTQTVSDGDIITAGYYNAINGLLGWSKVDGKMCKFVTGKIVCIDDVPSASSSSSSSWWGVTTPMNKTTYIWPNTSEGLSSTQLQENVDARNNMVNQTIESWKWIYWENSVFVQEILKSGGWKDMCTMSNTTFTIPEPNLTFFNECWWNICWVKHGGSLQSTVQCWSWSPTCSKWFWTLVCMY